ncbi:hypothetical protein GCM10027592_29470 [Spirosoma flavus]
MIQAHSWAQGPYYNTGAENPYELKFFRNGKEIGAVCFATEKECREFQHAHNNAHLN